jgi:2-phospho-L-lactate guanylyltransferase
VTWAVLPVKPFSEAKSRLEGVLSAEQRSDLARQLMLHSLAALQAQPLIDRVLVVSADVEALSVTLGLGSATLAEAEAGLNPALQQAQAYAVANGATRLLILASDLPLLLPSDIEAVLTTPHAEVVIAPDRRRQGTNSLLLTPGAIDFAFGEHSFERHLELARNAGVSVVELARPGLAFDMDLPDDWRDLLALGWRLGDALPPRMPAWALPQPTGRGTRAPALGAPRPTA